MVEDKTKKVNLAREFKAEYGISKAILDQNPDLQGVLDQLRADRKRGIEYEPKDIALKIQNTDWFRKHTSNWMAIQKDRESKDPAIWDSVVEQRAQQVLESARDAGASITDEEARKYAEQLIYGSDWNGDSFEIYDDKWLTKTLASAIDFTKTKQVNGVDVYDLAGAAEENAKNLYQMAYDYGIDSSMSNGTFTGWFEKSLAGVMDGSLAQDDVDNELRDQAMSMFPGMTQQLQRGQTLRQAADPYLMAISNVLDMNPGSIDLNDGLVQKVLNNVGSDGAFKPMSLYDAKLAARRDERFQYTGTAKKEKTDLASQILRDFGFLG